MALKSEYDAEAMEFYWYAKSADNMSLLQFLAYYQVIELIPKPILFPNK